MVAYSKPRAAIGIFGTPDALCDCLESLARAVPDDTRLYVLAGSGPVRKECAAIAASRLPAEIRQRIEYVEWRQPRTPDTPAPAGAIGANRVSDFRGWLNDEAANHLESRLCDGETVLFVPAPDAASQLTAFREMQKHVSGKVILQDLPV